MSSTTLYIQSDEREKPTVKNTLFNKALIQILGRNKNLYRQEKAKGIQYHQMSFTANDEGALQQMMK